MKPIKKEYLPGGAKRQELLTETEYLEALNTATNGGVIAQAWN